MLLYGKHAISVLRKFIDKTYIPKYEKSFLFYFKKLNNNQSKNLFESIINLYFIKKSKPDPNISFFINNPINTKCFRASYNSA